MGQIIVVGGGAAGMMAALSARESGADVLLLEPNEKLGRKLYITGKGRCNLCNNTDVQNVLAHIPRNGRFLYSALNAFPPQAVMEYFEALGVPLKTERGGRVFPVSDQSADVIDALFFTLKRRRVRIVKTAALRLLTHSGKLSAVETEQGTMDCAAAILATGGLSYPGTGSTGEGHRMAQALGHSITPLQGSLVPLETKGEDALRMQGLSLRNIKLTIKNQKKQTVFEEQGELLFTHFGISGPLVLSASAHMQQYETMQYRAILDLKPALDAETLDERLIRELAQQNNRAIQNILEALLPRLMIPLVLERSGIPGEARGNSITKAQRRRLLESLKAFSLDIAGARPLTEAVVTAGGVKTSEVDPKTLMSKKVGGLFFAGELLDVDAYTGGFNLQIAWSTGQLAGKRAAEYVGGKG